jgi:hypothetical protein
MAYTTFLRGIIIAFLTFLAPAFAMAATLSVSPASGSHTVGSVITVTVLANTQGSATDGIDILYLRFNPALLQVIDENTGVSGVQILPGALMPNTPVNNANNTAGTIAFSQVPAGGTTFTNTNSAVFCSWVGFGVACV